MAARRPSHGRGPKPTTVPSPSPTPGPKIDDRTKYALLQNADRRATGSREEVIESLAEEYAPVEASPQERLDLDGTEIPPGGSEVSLADEDEFHELPSAEQASSENGTEVVPDCRTADKGEIDIVVVAGRATFQVPDWASGYPDSTLDLRWQTYSSVADWLNGERPDFLSQPSVMNLAGRNIDLTQPVPVRQNGLLRVLGLPHKPSTLSKHARHCVIRWPSLGFRGFPLDGLWSRDVRLAWMAQAARERQETRGYAPKSSPLGDPAIQPPRASSERDLLKSRTSLATRMGPVEFVQLLCVLTDCKWRDVLDRYSDFIFYEE